MKRFLIFPLFPKNTLNVIVAVVVLGWLTSCGKAPAPLRVGVLAWPPYEFVFLAQQRGLLDDQRVQLVEFQSPAEAFLAYRIGGLDIVAISLDYALDIHAKDSSHQVFMVIDESLGGDAAISQVPLADLTQLAGKRIGLESSSLGTHILLRMLSQAGLTEADVELAFFDTPDQDAAFMAKKVDVMITYEPGRTNMLKAGGHEVFSSRDIPGEILDVFLARKTQMKSRRADFLHFTEAWFKVMAQSEANPVAAATVLGPRLGLSPQEFMDSLTGVRMFSLAENHQMFGPRKETFIQGLLPFVETVRTRHDSLTPPSLATLFTNDVLPAAEGAFSE